MPDPSRSHTPQLDRRRFLGASAKAGLVAGLPAWASRALAAGESDLVTVSILHTTDLHGHILPTVTYEGIGDLGGLARCATQIRRWRESCPNSLLLDIGDLYQGTHHSHRSQGKVMVDSLNRLGYDAWVIGNHEFDWGPDTLFEAIDRSKMPVLSSNLKIGEKASGVFDEKGHAFSKVKPYQIFEIAGFKIGVLGLTTPGLPYWLPESLRGGIEPIDAEEKTAEMVAELRAAGAHAIVVAGHLGMKTSGRDDYANPVRAILKGSEEIDVFIGGHTHQDFPAEPYADSLFTQAGYHGIYAGRVDLTFSRSEEKLIDRRAMTVLMDPRFDFDPIVMDIAKEGLEESQKDLATPVGTLTDPLPYSPEPAGPTGIQELIGAAIIDSLAQDGVEVDGVLHGSFLEEDLPAGEKDMADMWKLVPYENMLTVAHLTYSQLTTVLEETLGSSYNSRRLVGFQVDGKPGQYRNWIVSGIRDADGTPLDPAKRYAIAFNAYDAQSGGRRMERLRSIVREEESKQSFHAKLTRDALAEFFLRHKTVDKALIERLVAGA